MVRFISESSPPPISMFQSLTVPSAEVPPPPPSSSSKGKVVNATLATAATSLFIALVVIFFFFIKFSRCYRKGKNESSFRREAVVIANEFKKYGGRVKGLMVDENGADVLYMTKLDGRQLKSNFQKVMFNPSYEENKEKRG